MLDIDRCVNINSGIQQFLNILITLGVPTSFHIGMGQFVHQNQLRFSLQRTINIKLTESDSPVIHLSNRKLLQAIEQCHCLRSGMGFNISGNHVHTAFFCLMRSLQHGIGFSYTGSVTEEDFQLASFLL